MSKKDYGECPECGQKKLYLSKAYFIVCGNKVCGQIFSPVTSEMHLNLRQQIKAMQDAFKIQEKLLKVYKNG